METYSTYNDQELAELLRWGDAVAFRTIYDKYWAKLLFVASKRLNDTFEAEELVQDIFLNLWKKRAVFELKVSFENYLAVAVKFEIYKHRAMRARQETLASNLTVRYAEAKNQDWNLYDLHVLQDQLSKTISSLPTKCRLVFTMSRQNNMTNKQIATHLGISEKAVEKHMSNAFRVIRGKFGRYFVFIFILKDLF